MEKQTRPNRNNAKRGGVQATEKVKSRHRARMLELLSKGKFPPYKDYTILAQLGEIIVFPSPQYDPEKPMEYRRAMLFWMGHTFFLTVAYREEYNLCNYIKKSGGD